MVRTFEKFDISVRHGVTYLDEVMLFLKQRKKYSLALGWFFKS